MLEAGGIERILVLISFLKKPGWTRVFQNGKQFLLHWWHSSCYSSYKPGDNSVMLSISV
jgi:hypothetical protein